MPITKKIIGKQPINFGPWYAKEGGWEIKNRVNYFGSEFESKIDNNTEPPAWLNEETQEVTFNTEKWEIISNGTDAWLASDRIHDLGYYKENPEYVRVYLDKENKILEGTRRNGTKVFTSDVTMLGKVSMQGVTYILQENPEWIQVIIDAEGRILGGITSDGVIKIPLNILEKNNYIGKTVSYIGDSLSSGILWAKGLQNELRLNVNGTGIGGTSISGTANTCYWQNFRINNLDLNAFAVIIEGGTNDINNNTISGDRNIDNYDTSTFFGAFNVMLSKIYYKYLKRDTGFYENIDYSEVTQVQNALIKIPILVIIPAQILIREGDEHYPEWVDGIKRVRKDLFELCELWGLDYIDMNTIGYNFISKYESDAVHGMMSFFDILGAKIVAKFKELNYIYNK